MEEVTHAQIYERLCEVEAKVDKLDKSTEAVVVDNFLHSAAVLLSRVLQLHVRHSQRNVKGREADETVAWTSISSQGPTCCGPITESAAGELVKGACRRAFPFT